MGRAGRDILQSGCRHCRSQNILELAKNELYYHTDNHGCPRMTRRIILSHGQSRMSTDDTENIITCTIADVHGRYGELYYHTDNHGCPLTARRIIILFMVRKLYVCVTFCHLFALRYDTRDFTTLWHTFSMDSQQLMENKC